MPTPYVRATTPNGRTGNKHRAIIEAALMAFHHRGYFGTSIRDIAGAADVATASLYHHFANKQEILRVVMTLTMQEALVTTRRALVRAGASPDSQLTELMRSWISFHTERQVEAHVGAAELACLEDDGRILVVALRDEQERMFLDVITRGVENGVFHTPHPREAARAIVNMGPSVATWFRPEGHLTPAKIAEIYASLALATVQFKEIP